MLALAIALTRSWTATYTRGLPAAVRDARCAEIDCDLWEHQRLAELQGSTGTAVEILQRLICGLPADVTWRFEAGTSARSGKVTQVNESLLMRGLFTIALATAAFPLIIGILVFVGLNGEMSDSERAWFGPIQIAIGGTIICGLVVSLRRPVLGIGLVAAGVIAISVLWYWAAMITVPIGFVLLAVANSRARRTGWRWPRGAGLA